MCWFQSHVLLSVFKGKKTSPVLGSSQGKHIIGDVRTGVKNQLKHVSCLLVPFNIAVILIPNTVLQISVKNKTTIFQNALNLNVMSIEWNSDLNEMWTFPEYNIDPV